MINFYIYFEKRDTSAVNHKSLLRYGYINLTKNQVIELKQLKSQTKPFTKEEDARDVLRVLKNEEALTEYRFLIVRDVSYIIPSANKEVLQMQ